MDFDYEKTQVRTACLMMRKHETIPTIWKELIEFIVPDQLNAEGYHVIFISTPFRDKGFYFIRNQAISSNSNILITISDDVCGLEPMENEMIIEMKGNYTYEESMKFIDTINRVFKREGGLICFDFEDFRSLLGNNYECIEYKWEIRSNHDVNRALLILSFHDSEEYSFNDIYKVVAEGNELVVDIISSDMINKRSITIFYKIQSALTI